MFLLINIGFTELIALLTTLGGLSGIILYLLNRKVAEATSIASINKINAESQQITQDVEVNYTLQIHKWLKELEEISKKHHQELIERDNALAILHKQNLDTIKKLDEANFYIKRKDKATQKLMSLIDTPYWETDGQGQATFFNGAWLTLAGARLEEMIGEGWTKVIHPDDVEQLKITWFSNVVDHIDNESLNFRIINHITKETIPVRAVYTIVHDVEGNISKIIGVTYRISNNEID